VRQRLESQLLPEVECAELWDLSPRPAARNLAWRQHATELGVQRAVQLQREDRHLLLCGDPVAAVEALAAPAAADLQAVAVCLLDAAAEAQSHRLLSRGDDTALLHHHLAFAEWMRRQATDPLHMLEVVTTNGWADMCWERIPALAPQWRVHTIDTTDQSLDSVAAEVLRWIQSAITGDAPLLRPVAARS